MKQIPFSTFTTNAASCAEICSRVSEFILSTPLKKLKIIYWKNKIGGDFQDLVPSNIEFQSNTNMGLFNISHWKNKHSNQEVCSLLTPLNPKELESKFLPFVISWTNDFYKSKSGMNWWNNNVEFLIED